MSFQGDVRGIGLAELLQGLARGRKEGVLTLTSKGEKRAVLGLEDGKAWLLPDPDEEVEDWKTRGRDAWADDPSFTIEPSRMEPIVKAGRLEQLYSLLDGGGGDATSVMRPACSATSPMTSTVRLIRVRRSADRPASRLFRRAPGSTEHRLPGAARAGVSVAADAGAADPAAAGAASTHRTASAGEVGARRRSPIAAPDRGDACPAPPWPRRSRQDRKSVV